MASYARSQLLRGGQAFVRGGAKGHGWYHRSLQKMNAPKPEIVKYDAAIPKPKDFVRPQAFLDVTIGGNATDRIVIELAKDVVPTTVQNFLNLCTKGVDSVLAKGSYKGSRFHNITKGSHIVGGDFVTGKGLGGHAALEKDQKYFDDENFALQFSEEGVIGMANSGVHRNASQFFISLKPLPHLNGRNVAFGKVVQGQKTLKAIENVFCVNGKPLSEVIITDCGLL